MLLFGLFEKANDRMKCGEPLSEFRLKEISFILIINDIDKLPTLDPTKYSIKSIKHNLP